MAFATTRTASSTSLPASGTSASRSRTETVVMARATPSATRPPAWSRSIERRSRTPKVRRRFAAVLPIAVTTRATALAASGPRTVRSARYRTAYTAVLTIPMAANAMISRPSPSRSRAVVEPAGATVVVRCRTRAEAVIASRRWTRGRDYQRECGEPRSRSERVSYPCPGVSGQDPFGPITCGRPRSRVVPAVSAQGGSTPGPANRAPPEGDRPTAQRPDVARTIASPIARPSPAPSASDEVFTERWNRSKMLASSSAGMPGPDRPR